MARLDPPFRQAVEADGPALAALINEASHGLSLYAWTRTAPPGTDPWAVGAEIEAARAAQGLWTVVDEGAGPVSGLQVWPPGGGAPPSHSLSVILAPVLELRALAPEALYVNVVATLPEARGRGLGSRLMRLADEIARAAARPGLCLNVADDNLGAQRFYERHGYRRHAARPMVKEGWDGPGSSWLLFVKALGSAPEPR